MQEAGEFTAHMSAAFALHEADKRYIAQLEQRVQALEAELAALKNGAGISIIIAGQRFDLAPDEPQMAELPTPLESKRRAGTAFLSGLQAGEPNGRTSGVEDSFVL